jgi:predicted phage tail protein
MLREIKLSGSLRRFGRSFALDVASPREACQALAAMIPAFRRELIESARRGVRYAVFVDRENVGEDEIDFKRAGTIRIVPVFAGSARGGVLQTILGVVLVIVGALYYTLGAAYGGTVAGPPIIGAGISLIIGVVIQMLTPVNKDRAKQGSTFFDGPANTTIQGGCVPYLYGEGIVGSVRISAGLDILDVAVYGDASDDDPAINYG